MESKTEYYVANIEKVVHQFYFDAAEQYQAHQWLTVLQLSPNAWKFCWELMQLDKSTEVQFFGASTLQLKITRYWNELTEDQHPELKQKLLNHILKYGCKASNIILRRLCIALSCYVIRTMPNEWQNAIVEIIQLFEPHQLPEVVAPDKSFSMILQFLTVLPEEFQTISMGQTYRASVRHHLELNTHCVLSVIQQALIQQTFPDLHLQALECFRSWVAFGISLPDHTQLVQLVMQCFMSRELTEMAADVLSNIITHPDTHKYSVFIVKLLGDVLQLENLLLEALHHKDMELSHSLFALFVSLGETHSRLLLEEFLKDDDVKNNVLKLLRIILMCSNAPGQYPLQETCSVLAFGFWYNFQDDIMSSDIDKCQEYLIHFIPVYDDLVDVLLVKVMSNPNSQNNLTWMPDEKEQYRCYRQDVGDTLSYCFNILRTRMLERLLNHMTAVITRINNNDDVQQGLEACLFAFQSIAESVDLEDSRYIPQFLSLLLAIPLRENGSIIAAVLDAIAAYAEWISAHDSVLHQVIPLLLFGLHHPEASSSASIALKDICRDCQPSLRPYSTLILGSCQQVFGKGSLKPSEEIRLMSSIGYVLTLLPFDEIMTYLNSLLLPVMHQLNDLSKVEVVNSAHQSFLGSCLMGLSMLFSTLDTKAKDEMEETRGQKQMPPADCSQAPQPVFVVLQEMLPLLKNIATTFASSPTVVDGICELLKRAMATLLEDAVPILNDTLGLMCMLYRGSFAVAVLDLFKLVCLIFATDSQQKSVVQLAFINIVDDTLRLSQSGISEHSDVAEGFLQLLAQLLKKNPSYILHENINLLKLFQYGIVVLSVPEAPAVKAASSFMVNFLNYSREVPSMVGIVNNHGESLLNQILLCIGGSSPRGVMDSLADILLTMNKKYFDNMCRWLKDLLSKDNFISSHVNAEQKERFAKLILKERSNKRKLQEIVKEFTLTCRGLIGTEYAQQILPSL